MKITPRRARALSILGATVLRAVGTTWKIRTYGCSIDLESRRVLAAFLHGDMLLPAIAYRREPGAIMISQHGDGEMIASVIRRMTRLIPVRGSSTRGGARAFLEMVKEHGDIPWAITPDGPRGPRGSVNDGVIALASESGRPITPIGYAVDRARRLRSWDRFVIPMPFARVAGYVGEPMAVPAGIDKPARREHAAELEQRLQSVHEEAVRALDSW